MNRNEKFLAFGRNKIASAVDLKTLMNRTIKDVHKLRFVDLSVKDKMNYASCERFCQPHIPQLLKEKVSRKLPVFKCQLPFKSLKSFHFFNKLDSSGT